MARRETYINVSISPLNHSPKNFFDAISKLTSLPQGLKAEWIGS